MAVVSAWGGGDAMGFIGYFHIACAGDDLIGTSNDLRVSRRYAGRHEAFFRMQLFLRIQCTGSYCDRVVCL
jgi:hypothetical protein